MRLIKKKLIVVSINSVIAVQLVSLLARRTMGDRYNIHSQLEHLQSKYIGTGHADTAQFEWCVNQQRDTYASYMGHFDMLNMIALAENETKARVRFNMMEKMVQPCGPPPEKNED
ncbi:splicing factor 3B subunit 5 isoform X1 [Palaemon carinicauda]|uniref:splicing factor 3B subunit 5 isoform X1 n=1 Tax=Palaemon carinicauda TaxID=392227 RepID=UPI0035B5A4BC